MLHTPGEFSGAFVDLGASFFSKRAAEQQGGLLTGKDPTEFNPKDPIRIWIIQIGIIILTTQVLALGLRRIRQPQVIAEVLGGIVLGPTLMGRIPGFTKHIFPDESKPYLALTANIGLVLFLFLVGLEIDTKVIKRNARTSLIISTGGILLPFGLGAAVAVPVYNTFVDPNAASFPHFLLFVGVAFSITAFPVLCRILTELKLLDDLIGIVVLSAGVGNDIVGWTLLALTVALVNASSGLTALYVLLSSVAWTIFLLIPVKRAFKWFARWTGSTENGPTPLFMTATVLLVFGSAFFTDVIGVHAIFGGFLAGMVIPHEGGLAITITEKLEDMVSIIFLPLYFTLSGLSTNLGLLDNGITWGYTILILVVAYIGKFVGGAVAARVAGFKWREAATIGTLLSCKGLVELIVLNVGLSAGILDTRVFSMFVLEALVLTFASTPVTLWLYPPHLRTRAAPTGANFAGLGGPETQPTGPAGTLDVERKSRFLVVLDRMEHMPSIMTVTQLLRPPQAIPHIMAEQARSSQGSQHRHSNSLSVDRREITSHVEALRLVELTERTSDLMRSSVVEDLMVRDPLLNVYRTFSELQDLRVVDRMAVAQQEDYYSSVNAHSTESGADMVFVSWLPPMIDEAHSGGLPGPPATQPATAVATSTNPFDALFRSSAPTPPTINYERGHSSIAHSNFIRQLFASAPTDVALFVDPNHGPMSVHHRSSQNHLVVPFFGGPDDRLVLEFVVQLCQRVETSATVIRAIKIEADDDPVTESQGQTQEKSEVGEGKGDVPPIVQTGNSVSVFPDTIYANTTTQTRLASDTADNICWNKYITPDDSTASPNHTQEVASALTRMTFTTITSPTPLHALSARASALASTNRGTMLVVGRAKRLAVESHHQEMKNLIGDHPRGDASLMKRTLGDVATYFVARGISVPILVMQSSQKGDH